MDYEQKYKEALETARKINSGEGVAAPKDWSIPEIIFPELKKSEDELIREEFNNFCVHGDIRNPNFEGPFGYDDIRKTAIHFAQWQKEQLINKACEWLKENIYNRVYKCNDGLGFPTAAFLEEFKKAMEDK